MIVYFLAIGKGDSGALVVDAVTAEIYGQVIARSPLGDLYLVPLTEIVQQLKEVFAIMATVTLTADRITTSPQSQLAQKEREEQQATIKLLKQRNELLEKEAVEQRARISLMPGSISRHARGDSEATGMTDMTSSGGYPETTQSGPPRRHDYDMQAMETSLASLRAVTRNPIPAPTVTVRSEFPTISRSRQQQTLTCLVTIEVPDNKWRPDPEDLQGAPPMRPGVTEEGSARPSSPARSAPRFYPYESSAEMTESLRSRVDNWHGLDFSR